MALNKWSHYQKHGVMDLGNFLHRSLLLATRARVPSESSARAANGRLWRWPQWTRSRPKGARRREGGGGWCAIRKLLVFYVSFFWMEESSKKDVGLFAVFFPNVALVCCLCSRCVYRQFARSLKRSLWVFGCEGCGLGVGWRPPFVSQGLG